MSNSFFFNQSEKDEKNENLINSLEKWATDNNTQVYVVDKPLGNDRYEYNHTGHIVILSPGKKIVLVNFNGNEEQFEEFTEDFIEDIGSLSDKYEYKNSIGRPRKWRNSIILEEPDGENFTLEDYISKNTIEDPAKRRISELVVSLIIGSINNIEKATINVPDNLLDKVKQKIQLFDGDQTRFIYQDIRKKTIHIQGLSGTGKTELLLHKLKDIYIRNPNAKIVLTCHNKILAHNLKRRIPEFFNFMKVEQQIEWNERLWCMHAWGSKGDLNSGTYRFICSKFKIPFLNLNQASFNQACQIAIDQIKEQGHQDYAFDYTLIDESQDFPQSFLDLCELVTKEYVIIAGDIFQSIFDAKIKPSISPDFLLSKCYRTDPRALMFSHALGMGLFEDRKLRWLDDEEWSTCGYIVEKSLDESFYRLKREPLRRFEDLSKADTQSVSVLEKNTNDLHEISQTVLSTISEISQQNPTITPDDIGIILVDSGSTIYALSDILAQVIPRQTGWPVNKAVETKQKIPGEIFVSNRNNVKGLEFPFIICVTKGLNRNYAYRNTLYMTMTRSFLKSYLIITSEQEKEKMTKIMDGLDVINNEGVIEAQPPTQEEREEIMTTITQANVKTSIYDLCEEIFDEINVMPIFRSELRKVILATASEEFDREQILDIARFNYSNMLKKGEK
ncbi:DEAD/DEAH box helicase [Chromohalobacter israelensis]|uniref:DEAD/DEAH box helicase n=1 Tax=Chromohalobacter israelensis TaxID=141390 RepID=UPI003AF459AF